MTIKIKAKESKLTVGPDKGEKAFRLRPEKYNTLDLKKTVEKVHEESGIKTGTITNVLETYADVMITWLTEGHSVIIPGFGTMRFAFNASVAKNLEDVNSSLIKHKKIIFTPTPELLKILEETKVIITCYDEDGNVIKTVRDDVEETDI